jgi:hypothetical protein
LNIWHATMMIFTSLQRNSMVKDERADGVKNDVWSLKFVTFWRDWEKHYD